MTSGSSHDPKAGESDRDPVAPVWRAVRDYLRARKSPVDAEIRSYPPPIPACDAHFNHLLEERNGLSRELVRLDALQRDASIRNDPMAAIESFLRTSSLIDAQAVHRISEAIEDRAPVLAQRIAALEMPPSTDGSLDRSVSTAGH